MFFSYLARRAAISLAFFGVASCFGAGCQTSGATRDAPAAQRASATPPRVLARAIATKVATAAATAAPVAKENSVATKFDVVATFPHDAKAFTQGLLFHDGFLYESTGLEGASGVRRVEIKSGRVLARAALPPDVFGEGLALVGRELYQISWRNGRCFVFDAKTLKLLREYSYEGEGWGLTFDGKSLIQSDGSDILTFRDPKTFKAIRTLQITENGAPLFQLNELEVVGGEIWANVWHSERIVRLDAKTGRVSSYLDCGALFPRRRGGEDVLNGIAFDAKTNRIFVTGKLWPKVFALRLKK